MDITILPGGVCGEVAAIPSKSQAHRALICAALAGQPTRIICEGGSLDIVATVECLTALGVEISCEPGGFVVNAGCLVQSGQIGEGSRTDGFSRQPTANAELAGLRSLGNATLTRAETVKPCSYGNATPTSVETAKPCSSGNATPTSAETAKPCNLSKPVTASAILPCGESGSTFRFLLPIACVLGRSVAFMPEGRLPKRPLSPLYEELCRHGCTLSPQGAVPFHISGKLRPGSYAMDAGVSSQFISGLLFALPILGKDSELRLTGNIESMPYVEMTTAMQKRFGIESTFDGTVFSIPGNQKYRSPGVVHIEGDWSNAAFWLCAGAIGAVADAPGDSRETSIICTGLDLESCQGDRAIIDILTRFGAQVIAGESAVTVSGGNLRGIEIDAKDIPDLVPVLAVVAAAAEGVTVIRNAGRLRTKESDRLAAVTDVLGGLGADVKETEDGLRIRGGTRLRGGTASSWGDHRIAMMSAIAAAICKDPVEIIGAEAVSKSYPTFFEDLQSLGGGGRLTIND